MLTISNLHRSIIVNSNMANITLYSNGKYYYTYHYDNKELLVNLNDTLPQLNYIYPKCITCYSDSLHFIMDINNNIHILSYGSDDVKLYDNVHICSTTNCITTKTYIYNSKCELLLFSFDEYTNVFTVETVNIPNILKLDTHIFTNQIYLTEIKYIKDIQSYEFGHHDSIILKGFNSDIHIYNHNKRKFDTLFNVKHKLYIMREGIYSEHDGRLYNTDCWKVQVDQ